MEVVSPYSAHATIPYPSTDEFNIDDSDRDGYEEACSECTRFIREMMRRRRKEMEDLAR
jgi:hypothetical protein